LILDGFPVSRRRARPTLIHVCGSVRLRKTIVALGRGGFNDCAKHFELDHNGHNVAAAARFYQFLVYRLIAATFEEGIIIVSRHLLLYCYIVILLVARGHL
jgi:hypothetical protein